MIKKPKNTKNRSKRPTTKHQITKHVKAGLVYVAPHRFTGKKLTHRHTSHGALLLILLLVGIVLLLNLTTLNAAGVTGSSGGVNVTLTVPGAPPATGAVITSPQKKSLFSQSLARVSGTCPTNTFVAIYVNGLSSGSSMCQSDGSFDIVVQLVIGNNTLQAQNYDALYQPGPATEQIEVAFAPTITPVVSIINTPDDIRINPAIPVVPAAAPSANPCNNPVAPSDTSNLGLSVSCMTRNIYIGEKLDLPVLIWGGTEPYALSVHWGEDDSTQVVSIARKGVYALSRTYNSPKVKDIWLYLADAEGRTYQLKTTAEVNDASSVGATSPDRPTGQGLSYGGLNTWLEASVPIYWAAVSLILGFWIGDIFQRIFSPVRYAQR